VQVARLAGMPASLVRQARATLEALEAKASAGEAQIDLFAAPPEPEPTPPTVAAETDAALAALHDLDPDALTPREALDALYRLKSLSQKPHP
jgi:DNA mismatch repair protein MutS